MTLVFVTEALRWQNGLEASYTRGVFHALGRYGVREATVFGDIAPLLSEANLELLEKNAKAVFYEPLVGSAAHALATVCDRVRYGTIPESVAAEAMARGTPDELLLAEKIVHDLDKARGEVVVDFAVLEVSKNWEKNLGLSWPSSFCAVSG